MEKTEARVRALCVDTIACLYPPDSEYEDTARIGREIIMERVIAHHWRELPVRLLEEIANAMVAYEHSEEARPSRIPF